MGREKDLRTKRDAFDYGFVPFARPKKEKTEKAKKGEKQELGKGLQRGEMILQ
jgi:hypothetical protein